MSAKVFCDFCEKPLVVAGGLRVDLSTSSKEPLLGRYRFSSDACQECFKKKVLAIQELMARASGT